MALFELEAANEPIPVLRPATPVAGGAGGRLRVAGRELEPTPVFNTYWFFAAERQRLYQRRLDGQDPPWTTDSVLSAHRFTNVYRAADRVSQYLIRDVIYGAPQDCTAADMVFRVLLFKMFNKIETWQYLERRFGPLRWSEFDLAAFTDALDRAMARGAIYSAAYVIPPPKLGAARKHANHLRLIDLAMNEGTLLRAVDAQRPLERVFLTLRELPSLGNFLAFQIAIDLNYSPLMDSSENDYVVAGPGARDGIRKCFGPAAAGIEEEIIRYMVDHQHEHFQRLGLHFPGLFGRALHLIDCQNLFCEVDKYARVAHPHIRGISGRTRIKQKFAPAGRPPPPYFPPKWSLNQDAGPASDVAVAGPRQTALWS